MAFGLAAETKTLMEAAGYHFSKREEDGWWNIFDGDTFIDASPSLGDIIRKHANKQGAW